jgi:deoxyribodipyrimidine photo-lyase
MQNSVSIFWHRRDLRFHDNAGLYHALKSGFPVQAVFIFDTAILDVLQDRSDARVTFIYDALQRLNKVYQLYGAAIKIYVGRPMEVWPQILRDFKVAAVFTNRDYEPYAQERDKTLYDFLQAHKIPFTGYKDQVIFEKNEVMKDDGKPYTVYTAYSRKWKQKCNSFFLKSYPNEKYASGLFPSSNHDFPSLAQIGFQESTIRIASPKIEPQIMANYHETRDIPAIHGTTRLSVHLRFGTISIRELARKAQEQNEKYLNELIWRDFYQMILFHFPHSAKSSFKPAYDRIPWRNNEQEFEAWKNGQTGYPFVDAGMRELLHTGFMHNRVRMIVASFLSKHLLIDWRWGEAWFAEKLLDFDLASNVGGWQWAASSGCDAAPYFRVFNPALQTEKFDPEFAYIRKWVPEFQKPEYVKPIVDHKMARDRVIAVYKKALQE